VTTVNDISDLLRILQERPEWLSALRGLVLTEEVMRLPETVAQLVETVQELARQTAEQFRAINERLDRLETDVAGLKTDMVEVKADVAGLKTDMAEVKADVAGLKTDMAEVKSEQTQTNRRLSRVENQISDLRGDIMEITAAKRVVPRVIQERGLYHCDTIVGPGITLAQEHINDIRRAETAGIVQRGSDQEIALSDLLLHGRRSDDDRHVWVVIEASARIDEHDVNRARRRADILDAVYNEPALAIVVGESIDERDAARAEEAGVTVITLRPRYRQEQGEYSP
jgi:uncharacterized protein (UPF0335 family)